MSTTVKVLSAKKEVASHTIQQGEVLVLQAQDKVNYQLINDATGRGPQNIFAKRDGKNLVITLDEGNTDPDIIIENYYEDDNVNNVIVGLHEDGNIYAYVPESGEVADAVSMLAEEMVKPQALGGEELSSFLWAFNPWWLAGAAAVIGGAALVAAASGSSSDKGNSAPANNTGTTPTTINAPAQPVAVADPSNLTEAEKQAVKNAIKSANPNLNLTDDQIVVSDNGTATVTPTGQTPTTFTPAQVSQAASTEIVAPTVDTVTENPDGSKTITGKATPGALVQPKDEQGNPIGEPVTADEKGNYTATVPAGTTPAEVTQTVGGVESAPTDVVSAPTVDTVTENPDGSKTITGKATPGALVQPKDEQGNPIGEPVKADEKGNYTATVPAGTTPAEVTQTVGGVESAPVDVVSAPTVDTVTENPDGTKTITGTATPGALVQPKDEQGNPIGEPVTADEKGNYTATVPAGTTPAEVTQTVGGVESAPAAVDTTAPQAPMVDDVATDDKATTISGTAEPNATVEIKDKDGNVVGTAKADDKGNYTVTTDKPLADGEYDVVAKDEAGNESTPAPAEVDTTAPEQPKVIELTAETDGTTVKGTTEPNATVEVKDKDGNVIGTATADDKGNFEVPVKPALTAGETYQVTATDDKGNESEPKPITGGQTDFTAPDAPVVTDVVDNGDNTNTVKGTAEPNATVEVKDEDGNVIGTTTADDKGNFEVKVPALEDGKEYDVTATDAAGNESAPDVIDLKAPQAPTVDDVATDDKSTTISGTAEPNATVEVKDKDGNVVGTATADDKGNYTVTTDKPLADGEYDVVAKDEAGNESTPAPAEVDTTAPQAPMVDDVATDDKATTISGTAEPNATVEVKDKDGNVVGTATADDKGNYTVTTDKPLADGEYDVVAKDEAGNESAPAPAEVDTTAPEQPKVIELTAETDGTTVKGTTEPNATVEVKDKDGNVIGTATADDKGNFEVPVKPALTAGETYQVTATDDKGNESEPKPITGGQTDFTAPDAPVVTDVVDNGDNTNTVKGTAEPNATVEVKDEDGNVIGTTTADDKGNFEVKVPALEDGKEYDVTATDAAGNESAPDVIDLKAPQAPTVDDVATDDKSTTISGTAEPNATVEVKDKDGNVVGTATADDKGNYTVTTDKPLADGEYDVVAKDEAGNESTPAPAEVDTTAPQAPMVDDVATDDKATTISGTAEPNATVEIKDKDGNVVGTAKADDKGNYTVTTDKPLADGEYDVVAKDEAGNESAPAPAEVDTTAPEQPKVIELTAETDGTTVKGTTEPNATVEVKDKDGNVIGTATADDKGNFEVPVKPALTAGETYQVTATDDKGNESEPKPITGGQTDFTAPDAPVVTDVVDNGDNTNTVKGTAEPNATVEVKDEDGNVIGTTTADDKGNFEVKVPALEDGKEYDVTATDAAGNESTPDVIDLKAPQAPTVDDVATDDKATTISGTAEPNATVEVKDKDGNVVGTTTADDKGNYTVTTDKPLADGEYDVVAKDEAGNESAPVPAEVDTTAPEAPMVDDVATDDKATTISGTAEPNATVEVKDKDGNVVGTTTADDKGNYTVTTDKPLADGEYDVVAKDEAGNESAPAPAEVDTTAPEEPAAVNPPAQPVEAVDPANLTDEEKQKVKDAIKAANPDLGLTDDQIDVANDGTAKVTPEGATEPTTFTPAQTVANNADEPAVNAPTTPVDVVDPTNLTDEEKQKVKDAIKAANPDLGLTDDQIDVANDGTAKVTPEGATEPTTFTPAQTVANNADEPAVNAPTTPVDVVDPTNLTDEEKQKVKDAIKAANPDLGLTDDQIDVANDGTAKVTPEGATEPTTLTPAQTVANNADEPAVNAPTTPVDVVDPTNLTDEEKQKVKDAIKAANPDLGLTDDQIDVANDGTAKVTPEGATEPTTLTPAQTVANNADEPAVNAPTTPVDVVDPTNLTDEEKQKVKDAIKAANPDLGLTDDQIDVANDGTAKVTPEGATEPTTFTPAQTVANNADEPAVNAPTTPVDVVDPTNLTDEEKQKVKDAIKAANPDLGLTDDQIDVANDGTAKVTPEGATEPTTFTPAQTVANNADEPAVNAPTTPVDVVDPTNLTDEEKQKVKDAIKAANPDLGLTDDQIDVANDGTAKVTPEGATEPTTLTPAQTVANNADEPAVNAPTTPVDVVDPTNLTDEEKQKVKDAIKAANPDLGLTDDQIDVANDGTAKVTPEGATEPTTFTPAQTVANNADEPAVNAPTTPVDVVDPTNLTDEEKQKVKDAIKAANPDLGLTDDQIDVANDGTAKVTPEGATEPTTLTPAQTVANNADEPAVNAPTTPVDVVDPTNLTDEEKQKVKDAIKAANPDLGLTDDQIDVANDGTAKVTPEGATEPTTLTPAQTVANNADEPAVNAPTTPVDVVDPTNLTDEEKQKVKDAIKAANPDLGLTDDQIDVANDGTAKVTPEGATEPTTFTPAQTVANNADEPAVNAPTTPVDVVDPTNLTDEEKQKVKDAIKAANPDLGLTDDQIDVANDGTAKVTPEGATEPTTFTPAQTVANNADEPAVNAPTTPVDVVDPTNLTDEEKQKVKDAIKAANPDLGLTDDQIDVANDGTAKVTPEGATEPTTFTPAQTVANNADEPAVNAPTTPVDVVDPTNLTEEEKQKVKNAIKDANPDLGLTDDQIEVANDGTAKVTPEGATEPTTFTPAQTVANNADEPAVNAPTTPVDVVDPTNLTEEEKQKVKDAIKDANPDLGLTDDQIEVANDGTAKVTPEGATEPTTFTPAQTVANNADEPAVNAPTTPVDVVDPTNLTDEEKQKVKDAIKDANPDLGLTDDQIEVANDGTAKVTPEGATEPTTFTPAQTVANNADEPAVNAPTTPVDVVDPTNLTDEEKQKVKDAIKAANPDLGLTDDQITVGNDGTAQVTPEGATEPTTFTPAQTVANNADEPAVNAPTTPVDVVDPTNLTDEEKQKVKDAIKAANPDLGLTDDQITVGNDGTAQVTPEGATEPTTFTPAQTVANNADEPADPEQPRDIIPPVVDVEPKAKDGTALPAGTVTVTPGADNDRLVINYTDETGIVHGVTETTKGQEKTLTFVKQGDTWALEQGELPTGVTVEGGVITFAPNSVLDGSRVTATGHKADLTAQHQGNAKDDSQEGDRGWSVYGTETESFTYNLSGANVTWTAGDNGDLMLRGVPANEHLIVEYTDNDGVRRSVEVARGREVGIANDARWYQVTDAEGNAISPSLLTNDFGTNIIRHVDRTANSSLNRFVLDGTKVKDGTAVMAWEKSNGDANGGEDIFLDSSSVGTGDQAVGNAITETLNKSRKDLTWNADTGFFEVSEEALAAPNGRESSWGIAPTKTPATPTDPVDTIDVIANEGGSVTIVPGADNEKIVVTYYDETGSVKGVEGMAGKTHTFNEVTTDDASADGAEPVKVTVGANNQVTVTLVKQNGAWVEEGKSALPDGFSMDGDNIKIAHNSIMGDTEITVSATNSTTAEAATDTGKVLLDEPTNDARHIHFRQFGEMTPELQKEMKDWATLNNLDSSKISATDYVIDDGQAPSKTHKAYAVETANGTKYYVMKNDIWYNSDENFTQGAISNQSGEVFVGYHDTMIFSKDALGTLPAGSEVKLWSIDLDKGGNWQYQDSYIVPRGVDQPLITPNEDGSVTIKSGANNDKLVVTFFDETNSGYTRNFTDLGSEGYNGDVIPLKMVSDAREGGSKNGATTFDTLMQASDQITMTLVKGDSGWVIENVMSSGKGDITEATRQGSGNIIVRNIENGADGLSFTLAPDSVMGNTKVNATGYLGTQQQAAEEKIAKVDEPTVKPKAYIETVGEMSQEMQDHLTPEIRADYYITDKSMVINPEKLEPSSEAHKNERYYSFKVVYTDLSGKQDSFFLVNDNGWKMSYKGNVVTLGSLEGAAQGFYVYNDLIVLPRSLSNTFKEGENIYLLTVDKDKAGAMQFLDSYVANEPVVSPIQNYRLTYKGTKPNHLTDNDYMPQDLDGNREFIGTYFHNGAEGRTRQGQNWLNDFTENSQPGDEGMIIDLKNDGHSTAVTWVYEPYLRALGKDQPLFIRGDGNDGVDLGNTNRTTGWNVEGYTSGRTSYNLGNWTKTGNTQEVTSPDINNKRISTTYDEYTSTDGYTVYIDNTMIVY